AGLSSIALAMGSGGAVKGVFFKYFHAGSTVCTALIMFMLFIFTQILVSLNDFCVPYIVTLE
ncbi:hypothetical protein, partial [Proteus mirabilis]|uniref:hypothetical protein n=1 Tax=Proteus mirabilis TaxID=584 RepID=UPI001953C293